MAELAFDSRVNYQKIFINDSVNLTVANPNSATTIAISHGLGYIPNVRVWFLNGNNEISTAVSDAVGSNIYPLTSAYTQRAVVYTVNASNLVLTFSRGVTTGTTRTTTIYYRIYLDQQ